MNFLRRIAYLGLVLVVGGAAGGIWLVHTQQRAMERPLRIEDAPFRLHGVEASSASWCPISDKYWTEQATNGTPYDCCPLLAHGVQSEGSGSRYRPGSAGTCTGSPANDFLILPAMRGTLRPWSPGVVIKERGLETRDRWRCAKVIWALISQEIWWTRYRYLPVV